MVSSLILLEEKMSCIYIYIYIYIYWIFCTFNDSPSKMMNNAFYFILKALFVLKIFKLLSWLFGHVEKIVWLER